MDKQPIEFIIDTGSHITIIPPIINPKKLTKTTRSFIDVNKSPIKFKGEASVEVKHEHSPEHNHGREKHNEFEDMFKNNHTIEGFTIDIQLKKDTKSIQQKGVAKLFPEMCTT